MEPENIFLFIPIIIGYGRIGLALLSLWFMPTNHIAASLCYILSGLLDAVNGSAARVFDQSTKFGAMLDLITIRCTQMCMLATLCTFYPQWMFLFQLSMTIDISCHWIYLYTCVLQGSASHGLEDPSGNPIMRQYWTSQPTLFAMRAGNELFYASLYFLHFPLFPQFSFNFL